MVKETKFPKLLSNSTPWNLDRESLFLILISTPWGFGAEQGEPSTYPQFSPHPRYYYHIKTGVWGRFIGNSHPDLDSIPVQVIERPIMATPTPPKLNHVFHLRGHMGKDTIKAGQHRSGPHRHITALEGGFLRGIPGTRGEGLDATLVTGGSDWILFDEGTNTAHLDVRTQGRTKDGECVYIHYNGYLRLDQAAEKFMSWSPDAKTTAFGEHHWWSAPNIEASGAFSFQPSLGWFSNG